jgi:2-polyprenyl-6-methoxyphenol hydroxylase-like FAD-dependent oxidoreductase
MTQELDTTVCVVGAGPAGLVLGLLLARQGVAVTVLEKHADFLRDFRGDTVHPSTLDLLDSLGLHDEVARLPGRPARRMSVVFDDGEYPLADFSRLPGPNRNVLFVPQWDLLDLLAEAARKLPSFTLLRTTEATGVIRDGEGRVTGIEAGDVTVRARLTVACDGRASTVRAALGLVPKERAAPIDVLWFRVPRPPGLGESDRNELRFGAGGMLVQIDRGDYFQCAFVVPKGGDEALRGRGVEAFRARVAELAPRLEPVVGRIASLDDVKLLTVRLNRLRRWHVPGALLIGDAAHAMSPVGGVGINLAVQDAVATARILGPKLADGSFTDGDLAAIGRRRLYPTIVTQALQRVAQKRVIEPALASSTAPRAPRALALLKRFPVLQAVPAYVIGRGVLPERI